MKQYLLLFVGALAGCVTAVDSPSEPLEQDASALVTQAPATAGVHSITGKTFECRLARLAALRIHALVPELNSHGAKGSDVSILDTASARLALDSCSSDAPLFSSTAAPLLDGAVKRLASQLYKGDVTALVSDWMDRVSANPCLLVSSYTLFGSDVDFASFISSANQCISAKATIRFVSAPRIGVVSSPLVTYGTNCVSRAVTNVTHNPDGTEQLVVETTDKDGSKSVQTAKYDSQKRLVWLQTVASGVQNHGNETWLIDGTANNAMRSAQYRNIALGLSAAAAVTVGLGNLAGAVPEPTFTKGAMFALYASGVVLGVTAGVFTYLAAKTDSDPPSPVGATIDTRLCAGQLPFECQGSKPPPANMCNDLVPLAQDVFLTCVEGRARCCGHWKPASPAMMKDRDSTRICLDSLASNDVPPSAFGTWKF